MTNVCLSPILCCRQHPDALFTTCVVNCILVLFCCFSLHHSDPSDQSLTWPFHSLHCLHASGGCQCWLWDHCELSFLLFMNSSWWHCVDDNTHHSRHGLLWQFAHSTWMVARWRTNPPFSCIMNSSSALHVNQNHPSTTWSHHIQHRFHITLSHSQHKTKSVFPNTLLHPASILCHIYLGQVFDIIVAIPSSWMTHLQEFLLAGHCIFSSNTIHNGYYVAPSPKSLSNIPLAVHYWRVHWLAWQGWHTPEHVVLHLV